MRHTVLEHGGSLLNEASACLKSAGIRRAWLTIDPNTQAEKFYRTAGWEHVGEKDGVLLCKPNVKVAV